MKYHHQHTTFDDVGPSPGEIGRWPLALIQLHQRLAPYFARSEPRRHALLYLQAIVSDIKRKNGWQIAEHAKQDQPYGMQRLLSRAVWDVDGVRDDITSVCAALPERASSESWCSQSEFIAADALPDALPCAGYR